MFYYNKRERDRGIVGAPEERGATARSLNFARDRARRKAEERGCSGSP